MRVNQQGAILDNKAKAARHHAEQLEGTRRAKLSEGHQQTAPRPLPVQHVAHSFTVIIHILTFQTTTTKKKSQIPKCN